MIINIPRIFGGTLAQPSQDYVPLSSEWLALDGVELTMFPEFENHLVFVSKTKDAPDEDDLVVVPNTVNETPYRFMLTLYRKVDDAAKQDIIGFVCGFYCPFGVGLVKHPVVGKL